MKDEDLDNYLALRQIKRKGQSFYQTKMIEDKGFNKWVQAQEQTFAVIKWVSLLITFKFYRMTYSFFMGDKKFLILYQKKKFKKHTVLMTLISQFLCELPMIISSIVAIGSMPLNEQLAISMVDSLIIAVALIVLEFVEIATLDRIMKTVNTTGHQSLKSAAAQESSEEEDILVSSTDSNCIDSEEDYPDWRLMLKHVEGNANLHKQSELQLDINALEKRFDLRLCESCIDFPTGMEEKEEDPRLVKSFPTSPREYKNFEGIDFANFGKNFDNVYAEAKANKENNKDFTDIGS